MKDTELLSRSLKSLLIDARALAQFADLDSDQKAEEFRHSVYPDFVPIAFWEMEEFLDEGKRKLWKSRQEILREAWAAGFPIELSVQLIADAAENAKFNEAIQQYLVYQQLEWQGLPKDFPKARVYPYQIAVMFLAMQPWRAQICGICRNHFVKSAPRDRYCSNACSRQAILKTKRKSWQTATARKKRF